MTLECLHFNKENKPSIQVIVFFFFTIRQQKGNKQTKKTTTGYDEANYVYN